MNFQKIIDSMTPSEHKLFHEIHDQLTQDEKMNTTDMMKVISLVQTFTTAQRSYEEEDYTRYKQQTELHLKISASLGLNRNEAKQRLSTQPKTELERQQQALFGGVLNG